MGSVYFIGLFGRLHKTQHVKHLAGCQLRASIQQMLVIMIIFIIITAGMTTLQSTVDTGFHCPSLHLCL